MFGWLNKQTLARQRQRGLEKTTHPVMREFLQCEPPQLKQNAGELECLVADLEMSGLDPNQDAILSIGYVPIRGRAIELGGAVHEYVYQPDVQLESTAPIHSIRHAELEKGVDLAAALERFLAALRGKVLVVHHKPLDLAFLNHACESLYGVPLITHVVDTLAVERKRHKNNDLQANQFRLHACRERYNLPPSEVHNALTDALATAELFLAQYSHISCDKAVELGYFL